MVSFDRATIAHVSRKMLVDCCGRSPRLLGEYIELVQAESRGNAPSDQQPSLRW